ncbi:MAG: hypothetical protein HC920_12680 [Oscillatoriales cyanobacterium SM2_3_0]|nr:hypothetical protein [Oscillatoriales cyanobacterium SM2_3_0]
MTRSLVGMAATVSREIRETIRFWRGLGMIRPLAVLVTIVFLVKRGTTPSWGIRAMTVFLPGPVKTLSSGLMTMI